MPFPFFGSNVTVQRQRNAVRSGNQCYFAFQTHVMSPDNQDLVNRGDYSTGQQARYPDLWSRLARSDTFCGKAPRGLPWFYMTMSNAGMSWRWANSHLKPGG